MAAIPDPLDPTLEAADRALEAEQGARQRSYLGMSQIGHRCDRKLWFDLHWASEVRFDAASLKRFADGHAGEALQIERLRKVDGLLLYSFDPETGSQFGFDDCNGHFKGHVDGLILGLIQAPKTWHVWEHKQVSEKKQAQLAKLKSELGEKNALKAWDEVYYSQAILYMHYEKMERHYLTCSTPGGRHTISVRTENDPAAAIRLIERAERIITAPRPPVGISTDPAWWECRMCPHARTCHEQADVPRNCRTCLHSGPAAEGSWSCALADEPIPEEVQRLGCDEHRLIPDLVAGEQVDVEGSVVVYRMRDGSMWRDEGPAP